MRNKPQRIRDPLHNLIEFGTTDFEQTLWRVVESPPFQRLRRIKQLGFSEIVYPGATHSRFSHSLGVYHIAKRLVSIIEKHENERNVDVKAQHALAAALLHDVGHGPFSHAFEEAGKVLGLPMAMHESVSESIILDTEVGVILDDYGSSGFKSNVAGVIKAGPAIKYGAVVSSQFDADRLDYMQRDRLMAGTQLSGIDFTWLISNLEVADIPWGDEEGVRGSRQSFVLGPKASYAAESYVLSLFQLYPTLYFHKATRCAEKFFTEIIVRIFRLVERGESAIIGLPINHPLIVFASDPSKLENALNLDDGVIAGALSMLEESSDKLLSNFSQRLRERRLFKCIEFDRTLHAPEASDRELVFIFERLKERVMDWLRGNCGNGLPRILIDDAARSPYKTFDEEKGLLNQIIIQDNNGNIVDLATKSNVVSGMRTYSFLRFYLEPSDNEARVFLMQLMKDVENG